MIVTIAEHFASDPSDREQSPMIIWKPGSEVKTNAGKAIYQGYQ